ncbi:hypothetical protein, partial [Nesterenkonia flava]|uniref:hypothetical protein n=1 Tax=Nesterenkonia flava TaxID=469799 RepID=UPI0031D82EA4
SIAKSDTDRRRHHSADHKRYPKPGMSLTTTQTTASNSRYVPMPRYGFGNPKTSACQEVITGTQERVSPKVQLGE